MDECSQMYCAIHWIEIYPVDSVIRPSNYRRQIERSGFKPKPGHCVVFISKKMAPSTSENVRVPELLGGGRLVRGGRGKLF